MPIHYKKRINKQRNNINNKYYNKSSKVLTWSLFSSFAPEPLPFPQPLQEVQVKVAGNRKCECLLKATIQVDITPSMLCAGGVAGKGACHVRLLSTTAL